MYLNRKQGVVANRRLPSANSFEKHHNAHTIRARNKSGKRVVVEYIHNLYTTYIIILKKSGARGYPSEHNHFERVCKLEPRRRHSNLYSTAPYYYYGQLLGTHASLSLNDSFVFHMVFDICMVLHY